MGRRAPCQAGGEWSAGRRATRRLEKSRRGCPSDAAKPKVLGLHGLAVRGGWAKAECSSLGGDEKRDWRRGRRKLKTRQNRATRWSRRKVKGRHGGQVRVSTERK